MMKKRKIITTTVEIEDYDEEEEEEEDDNDDYDCCCGTMGFAIFPIFATVILSILGTIFPKAWLTIASVIT